MQDCITCYNSSDEQLVTRIQAGERELLPDLWNQVEKYVRWRANRWAQAWNSHRIEADDLYQCGYEAMLAAVETFQEGQGASFTSWLTYYLLTAFSAESGVRTSRRDALTNAASLNTPLGDDADGGELLDLQPDPTDSFEDVERRVYLEQLHKVLTEELDSLPTKQCEAIKLRFFDGLTLLEIADKENVSLQAVRNQTVAGFRRLRGSGSRSRLEPFLYTDRNLYRHTGLQSWKNSGMSVEEYEVLRMEDLERRRSVPR